MTRPGSLVLPGVLLLAWLLLAVSDGITGFDLLAGLAAIGVGTLAGARWPKLNAGAARAVAVAGDLLGEEGDRSPVAGGIDGDAEPAEEGEGDADAVDDRAVPAALDALLTGLRESFGATRILLWKVEDEGERLDPEHGIGPLPRSIPAAGSPLMWALRERSSLRLDPVPRWARGATVVVPVDEARVLTVETPMGETPAPEALGHAVALLGPFLRLHDQHVNVVAARHRFDHLVDYLRSLPRERDPGRMPQGLARTAMEIVGGTGALVASWSGTEGQVLVREGRGGGPGPGSEFGVLQGDLAHAARAQSTVLREPAGSRWPDLASSEEDWDRPSPAYRVVFPLVDPGGETTGLVAVWGRTPPAVQGIELIEAVGPLLALQLRQADDIERLRERAIVDALTGLANRPALEERLAEEDARFHRHRRPAAVLVVDLDHFKRINDTHGHDAGDAVLRRVGEILQAAVRDVDFPARFGGEEFVVLLPETTLRAAVEVAGRVRTAIGGAVIEIERTSIAVTASVGVSACPECVEDPARLFASADQALYVAKNAGRDRVAAAPARVASGGTGAE